MVLIPSGYGGDRMFCSIDGCTKQSICKGLCHAHYRRLRLHGDPLHGGAALKGQGALCAVEGCANKSRRWGYCSKHAYLFKMNGDPLTKKHHPGRSQEFYQKTVLLHAADKCLIWEFKRGDDGYGIMWRDGKNRRVHRLVCEEEHGPPPFPDALAIHSCGNGHLGCCARKHVRWGTAQDNMDDREKHGRTPRWERCAKSKLTSDQVREVRSLYPSLSQQAIADRFGVTQGAISAILNGRSWRGFE